MNEFPDERSYAWRLVRAARQARSDSRSDSRPARDDLAALLDAAMDAGLDRARLIVELAELGGRLLALCDPVAAKSA